MTDKAFGTVAGILSAMPAQQRWDDGVAVGYALSLKDVDDKTAIDVVIDMLKTEDFRPSPAAILRRVRGIRCGETSVIQMFNRICRFLSDVHPRMRTEREVEWLTDGDLHPFDIVAVKYIGGWQVAGKMDRDKLTSALRDWTKDANDVVQNLVQIDVKPEVKAISE